MLAEGVGARFIAPGSQRSEAARLSQRLCVLALKHEQAEPLFQRALTISEERLGDRHPNTLLVRENYVSLLHTLGRSAEAEQVKVRGRVQEEDETQ